MISVVKRKRANYNLQIVIDVYSMSRDCGQSVVGGPLSGMEYSKDDAPINQSMPCVIRGNGNMVDLGQVQGD